MPSLQAQQGSRLPPPCQHALLASAVQHVVAVVTIVVVTAVEAAVVIDMGCNNTLHRAIQHVWHCASSKCKSVMVKVSMPLQEVIRGSEFMQATLCCAMQVLAQNQCCILSSTSGNGSKQ